MYTFHTILANANYNSKESKSDSKQLLNQTDQIIIAEWTYNNILVMLILLAMAGLQITEGERVTCPSPLPRIPVHLEKKKRERWKGKF